MLYHRDFATLRDAAFAQTAFRAPLLTYPARALQTGRDVQGFTHHRPTQGKIAGEGANSSDMFTDQPAPGRRAKYRARPGSTKGAERYPGKMQEKRRRPPTGGYRNQR